MIASELCFWWVATQVISSTSENLYVLVLYGHFDLLCESCLWQSISFVKAKKNNRLNFIKKVQKPRNMGMNGIANCVTNYIAEFQEPTEV